jgi:hypothetical protein
LVWKLKGIVAHLIMTFVSIPIFYFFYVCRAPGNSGRAVMTNRKVPPSDKRERKHRVKQRNPLGRTIE